ncbi:MAG: hypothetical protein ACRCUH_15275 [Shewanella sp.]
MSMNDLLIECQNRVAELESKCGQLANRVEELQAMQLDAQGDGYYDGYLACQRDVIDGVDPRDIKVNDILQFSEKYESEHRYSKSIADIRAKTLEDATRLYTHKWKKEFEDVHISIISKGAGFIHPEALLQYAADIRQEANGGE